ncbi:heme NO-binding domain-containing protein [Hugenholtzia roseola]|uniref:heme NO-binding domain-containing protein n=1 Tax=Hugenholtzia roseola TaxID=1002 RepID=UPI00041F91B2|nr:heme NO-binding domain-containing protein [Hugenholtzia roseola]
MRGTVAKCVERFVVETYGAKAWKDCLQQVNLPATYNISVMSEVDDRISLRLLNEIHEVLGLTHETYTDKLAKYWMLVYAPETYKPFYRSIKTLPDFLQKLDWIHQFMVKDNSKNTPRFSVKKIAEGLIQIEYQSERNLHVLFKYMLIYLAEYFKQPVQIKYLNEGVVQVGF